MKKDEDLIPLKDLYIGQLGVARRKGELTASFIPLNNSYIVYKKCPRKFAYSIDDYGIDVITSSEYHFFHTRFGFNEGTTYINNSFPISTLLTPEEISKNYISKDRISEILTELNKNKEKQKVQNSDIILNSIFNIIQKLKDTNIAVDNKEMTFNDLTELAKNYISGLIEIRKTNYSLDLTVEDLIRNLQNDAIDKLNKIVDNVDKGISIYSDDLTRTLEKK